jgi:hypothetical protein
MSKWKNNGIVVQEYLYDFSVHGGTLNTDIEISNASNRLPVGAILIDAHFDFEAAIVGSSSTFAVGNATTNVGYLPATAEATLVLDYIGSAAKNASTLLWDNSGDALIPYRIADADKSKVIVRIGTASLTAGKCRVFLWFLNPSAQAAKL